MEFHMLPTKILLLALLCCACTTEARLEPAKFENNRVYALENQHGGKYLTAGENGEPFRTGDRGTPTQDQKWRLVLSKDDSGQEGWKLVPLIDQPSRLTTIWRTVYVGHGKFQFKSTKTGKCLEASERGVEVACEKENLFQRWYPHPQKDV